MPTFLTSKCWKDDILQPKSPLKPRTVPTHSSFGLSHFSNGPSLRVHWHDLASTSANHVYLTSFFRFQICWSILGWLKGEGKISPFSFCKIQGRVGKMSKWIFLQGLGFNLWYTFDKVVWEIKGMVARKAKQLNINLLTTLGGVIKRKWQNTRPVTIVEQPN